MNSPNHGKLTNRKCYSIQLFFLQSINQNDQIIFLQFQNTIIQITLDIFKYFISIHRIAKFQSITTAPSPPVRVPCSWWLYLKHRQHKVNDCFQCFKHFCSAILAASFLANIVPPIKLPFQETVIQNVLEFIILSVCSRIAICWPMLQSLGSIYTWE